MYDSLFYRKLNDLQIGKIGTYLDNYLRYNTDLDYSVIDMYKGFLDSIKRGHKNLVYAVEKRRIVNICLYACDPASLKRYDLHQIDNSTKFIDTFSLTAPADWISVILEIEGIVMNNSSPKPNTHGIIIGNVPRLRASVMDCKNVGDYYIAASGKPYVLTESGVFVLLSCSKENKNEKDQLQGENSPGRGCSEGRIIYGRRDKLEYSAGRHCNQASAQGKGVRVGGYQVIVSVRSPKVHGYKE
jgi:hypothetical protein